VVALKRVRMDNEKEGFPITAIREIKILKILNHKNVVRLKEIVTSKGSDYNQGKGSIYMVMEFLEHDLTGLTDAGQRFTVAQIKCYMKQLLEGLAYCHAQKVLHRDIKGSNLLISNDGHLKLADFGLARPFDTDQQRPYTNRVITLWYRPPELLLGATMYGPAIDLWSAGCIFAELLQRKPILPGKNEFEQIDLIFRLLGTPDESTWPKCSRLQYYEMILNQNQNRKYPSRIDDKFAGLEPMAKDLLCKLLAMDPDKRISADDALDHEYFWSDPLPATPEELPKYPPSHEFTAKKRRQQTQQQAVAQHAQAMQWGMPPQQQHPHGHPNQGMYHHPPAAYNGPPPAYSGNNVFYAARGSGPGGAGGAPPGGYPPAKRPREGPYAGGHPGGGGFFNGGGGFFDPTQQQQQPPPPQQQQHTNGANGVARSGGYPGGGWPSR